MELRIWKFGLPIIDNPKIHMPKGAKILSLQTQNNRPVLWALCDPAQGIIERRFRVYGTGNPIDTREVFIDVYVGSFQLDGGSLVFHVFEA